MVILDDALITEWVQVFLLLFFQLNLELKSFFYREPSKENKETKISEFISFLEEDYQNAGQTLQTSLDKFKDRYNSAKSKSIPRLSSFLYNPGRNLNSIARVNIYEFRQNQLKGVKQKEVVLSEDCMVEKKI